MIKEDYTRQKVIKNNKDDLQDMKINSTNSNSTNSSQVILTQGFYNCMSLRMVRFLSHLLDGINQNTVKVPSLIDFSHIVCYRDILFIICEFFVIIFTLNF